VAWASIRGHAVNAERLQAAHRRGRLGHAWLLVGPPGIGKRTFAREFAKALLCETGSGELAACDACPSCKLVDAETHPDLLVARKPEDKQEFPIDTMREFLQAMGLKPGRGRRKVGFIEDAGDFNEESANAFLKTLEEPPPGSMMLLRAESLESQLSTILSRCQPLRFQPLSQSDVKAVLLDRGVTSSVAEELAKRAGGSVGRALALNDPALAEFRKQMLEMLVRQPFPGAIFADRWIKFFEEAGKDSTAQRQRVSLMLRLLADDLRAALRSTVGVESDCELRPLTDRLGPERTMNLLEAVLDADKQVEQRVKLELVLELLSDRIAYPDAA
jgi:DNA polymerase-3 subunit delta'